MSSKRAAVLTLCLWGISPVACAAGPATKLSTVEKVSAIHTQLIGVARDCLRGECGKPELDQGLIQSRVHRILGDIDDVEVLFRVAIVSLASSTPQDAGYEKVDLVFDFAWTESVQRIGSSSDRAKASEALDTLGSVLRLDGERSLVVKESREKLGLKRSN